jgi:hypothetical protein
MRIEIQKIFFISSISIFMLILWDYSIAMYWKILSVFLHETFHAVLGFLLGGRNISIILHSSESGTTKIHNLSSLAFPLVVSAGYLGNILFGSFLLSRAFQYKQNRLIAFFSGNWMLISVFNFLDPASPYINYILSMGMVYNIGAFLGVGFSSLLTLYLGITLLLYGVYDIYDIFMKPELTDAGILAKWTLEKGSIDSEIRALALNIGISWYTLSGMIIFFFCKFLIFGEKTGEKRIDRMIDLVNQGKVPKDVADWFLEKGKDIDGIPLSGENLKFLNRGNND